MKKSKKLSQEPPKTITIMTASGPKEREVVGYIYRGLTTVVYLGKAKVKLVQDETYVIPILAFPNNLQVTLKKPGFSVTLPITAREYYKYLSVGRSCYKNPDPYL